MSLDPSKLSPSALGRYFGPQETCKLGTCPIIYSVYGYRPSIVANSVFLSIYGVFLIIQIVQGIKWRTPSFTIAMCLGCISEVVGYGGRIMLWQNPFSYPGFLTQIICITLAPAFYSAAIYFTLSKIVKFLGVEYSRFSPSLYYWVFIPCDVISLTLQAAGGGISTLSLASNQNGVDITLAGLSFQVFSLVVFIVLAIEYAIRYRTRRDTQRQEAGLTTSFKVFVGFLSLAIMFIFVRCVYRIDELSEGYFGPLFTKEGLFIALEGVMIVLAVLALTVAHPGRAFRSPVPNPGGSSVEAEK